MVRAARGWPRRCVILSRPTSSTQTALAGGSAALNSTESSPNAAGIRITNSSAARGSAHRIPRRAVMFLGFDVALSRLYIIYSNCDSRWRAHEAMVWSVPRDDDAVRQG